MNNRTLAIVIIAIGVLSVLTLAMSMTAVFMQSPGPEALSPGVAPAGVVPAGKVPPPDIPLHVSPQGERIPCELLFVVDGDTIAVRVRGKQKHVRLLRINTVESDHPQYAQATRALGKLVGGGSLTLEFEGDGAEERDEYGRLLCYVWAGETMANLEMVRAGWSRFFTRYGEGKYATRFRQAQVEAAELE